MNTELFEAQFFEYGYALDTFYFLVCGALVMWMAAGFSMLKLAWYAPKIPPRSSPKTFCSMPLPAPCT